MKNWKLAVSAVILALATVGSAQVAKRVSPSTSKPVQKPPFVCSKYFWQWYTNGSTTFSFTIKNQSGHDVKSVRCRVLFFDRQGDQIDFAEGSTNPIPNGLAHRESVDLAFDTGMSTRKLSTYQKVEILDFEQND